MAETIHQLGGEVSNETMPELNNCELDRDQSDKDKPDNKS
jgi:hypothetical protein